MRYTVLLLDYMKFHYGRAIRSIWQIVGNFMWFFYHFFSVPLLLRTLWKPWHKLEDTQTSRASIGSFFEKIIINAILRAFGFVVRICAVSVGLLFVIGVFITGLVFTIFWIVAPYVGALSLLVGIRIIF